MNTQFYDSNVATVDYQILFTKRDFETVLEWGTTAVAKAMTGSGFASWKIAQFIRETDENGIKIPSEWKAADIAKLTEPAAVKGGRKLNKLYLEFLQVEYQVLSSLDRKPSKYDKDEVDVLQQISSTLQTLAPVDLPLDDPKVKGKLWNDKGTVKVSAGP